MLGNSSSPFSITFAPSLLPFLPSPSLLPSLSSLLPSSLPPSLPPSLPSFLCFYLKTTTIYSCSWVFWLPGQFCWVRLDSAKLVHVQLVSWLGAGWSRMASAMPLEIGWVSVWGDNHQASPGLFTCWQQCYKRVNGSKQGLLRPGLRIGPPSLLFQYNL